ncbi:hypothetical protein GGG16DRAFT_105318 [Schizophyllum commune]
MVIRVTPKFNIRQLPLNGQFVSSACVACPPQDDMWIPIATISSLTLYLKRYAQSLIRAEPEQWTGTLSASRESLCQLTETDDAALHCLRGIEQHSSKIWDSSSPEDEVTRAVAAYDAIDAHGDDGVLLVQPNATLSSLNGPASGHPPLTDCSHARDLVAVSFPSPVLELRATRRIAARSALFGLLGKRSVSPEPRFSDHLVPTAYHDSILFFRALPLCSGQSRGHLTRSRYIIERLFEVINEQGEKEMPADTSTDEQ